ncbi:Fur family transcriptional regulator [Emcibacter nanhaiensis]|uniref:Ferric uptake regulation protein n=1 Tax=Emcibacter nanhaiensis TaxID=1505037 RepID=A0A501PRG7_9PROT|nr:Fur family transcriptional regulator [Emcibacter nanhaiensis]TPD62672.1 transcriptional repressor [Emcibacter nanhaiensis]
MTQAAHKHDHDKCIEQALQTAREICDQRETRFTPLRRSVLELVWRGHKPVTAYELLDMLSQQGKKRVAPPTVYRALDFLIEEGLVHRLESLNAFIGCPDPSHKHQGHFLICRNCRTVKEVNDKGLHNKIAKVAEDNGYTCEHSMLEIMGLCDSCR